MFKCPTSLFWLRKYGTINILFICLIPPPIAYELIRQLQTDLLQKRSDRYRLPKERNNTACSPEAMAPEMPDLTGQQEMGSDQPDTSQQRGSSGQCSAHLACQVGQRQQSWQELQHREVCNRRVQLWRVAVRGFYSCSDNTLFTTLHVNATNAITE